MHTLRVITTLFISLFLCQAFAQQDSIPTDYDQKYREDQFYIGLTYNLLLNVPDGVEPSGVSGGINFGYLRDMPLNKQRNIAVAVGAGLNLERYGTNLFIGEETDGTTIFSVIDDEISFDRNSFGVLTVEAPVEFRWRSSTAESYKFWRVYLGVRFGYSYYYRARFRQSGNEVNQTDIPEFEQFRTDATLSFGYNTFNLYASYSINPFFRDATTGTGDEINFRTVRVGLIFYIL